MRTATNYFILCLVILKISYKYSSTQTFLTLKSECFPSFANKNTTIILQLSLSLARKAINWNWLKCSKISLKNYYLKAHLEVVKARIWKRNTLWDRSLRNRTLLLLSTWSCNLGSSTQDTLISSIRLLKTKTKPYSFSFKVTKFTRTSSDWRMMLSLSLKRSKLKILLAQSFLKVLNRQLKLLLPHWVWISVKSNSYSRWSKQDLSTLELLGKPISFFKMLKTYLTLSKLFARCMKTTKDKTTLCNSH